MTKPAALPPDRPFDRLLAALLAPGKGPQMVLAAYQQPLAIVELPDDGAGVVLLDHAGASADELRARLDRILAAHQAGILVMVVTGGGADVRQVLAAADRAAPDNRRLGAYHLGPDGRLQHVAGRRLRPLERAATRLGDVTPLEAADVPAIVERIRREREEASLFAHSLAGRRPWVTLTILGACIVMHALTEHWGGSEARVLVGANGAQMVRDGQVWRLLASTFLHASLPHLLMNGLALYSFGGFLETILGWRRYVVLYALAGLGGSLASALIANQPLSVGASGAVWGLMTFGFGLVAGRQSVIPTRIATSMRSQLVRVLMLNVAVSFLPQIDRWAHAGGGVVGLLLAWAGFVTPRPRAAGPAAEAAVTTAGDPAALRLGAVLAIAALVGSVAYGLAWARPWAAAGLGV